VAAAYCLRGLDVGHRAFASAPQAAEQIQFPTGDKVAVVFVAEPVESRLRREHLTQRGFRRLLCTRRRGGYGGRRQQFCRRIAERGTRQLHACPCLFEAEVLPDRDGDQAREGRILEGVPPTLEAGDGRGRTGAGWRRGMESGRRMDIGTDIVGANRAGRDSQGGRQREQEGLHGVNPGQVE
jgi:hypothetical protein